MGRGRTCRAVSSSSSVVVVAGRGSGSEKAVCRVASAALCRARAALPGSTGHGHWQRPSTETVWARLAKRPVPAPGSAPALWPPRSSAATGLFGLRPWGLGPMRCAGPTAGCEPRRCRRRQGHGRRRGGQPALCGGRAGPIRCPYCRRKPRLVLGQRETRKQHGKGGQHVGGVRGRW